MYKHVYEYIYTCVFVQGVHEYMCMFGVVHKHISEVIKMRGEVSNSWSLSSTSHMPIIFLQEGSF